MLSCSKHLSIGMSLYNTSPAQPSPLTRCPQYFMSHVPASPSSSLDREDYIACIQNMNLAFIIGLFMFDGPVQWQYWTPVCFILTFRLYEVLSRARMFYG